MPDQSFLDAKYFIDEKVYNCPFCNRRHVAYYLFDYVRFNWTESKVCYAYFVMCGSCELRSMHLSYVDLLDSQRSGRFFKGGKDLDNNIFYSVPTSFFVLDNRIPGQVRELITEAEGCLKMNFLTGASACMRKSIYELLVVEKVEGADYQTRIKALKGRHPTIDGELFDVLAAIQGMTSGKVHEQSWDKWDSGHLRLIMETVKALLLDIFVDPQIRAERSKSVRQLRESISKDKRAVQ